MVPDKVAAKERQDSDEFIAEILGLLARECGWSHDYIADHFTVQQIRLYYETIIRQKYREFQLQALCNVYAMATAFGSMKFADFKRFLSKFDLKKENINEALDKAKLAGLPIEDK